MSDDGLRSRIRELEADNARLRRFLERQGSPGGLRHQVRNTLSSVREFVRRSAETGHDVEDYAAHLDGRLDAVLRVQNAIANGPSGGEVSLHALVADELLAQAIGDGQRAAIAGPDITLKPIAAGAFALVLHELAVNAVKFGAMTVPDGMIDVDWSVAPDADAPRLTWTWIESGLSELPSEPPRRGFGTEVIERSLTYQINASTELLFARTGLRCTITLSLLPWVGALETSAAASDGPRGME